jgi:hypothetical protein
MQTFLRISVSAVLAASLTGCMTFKTDLVNADGKKQVCSAAGGGLGVGAVIGVAGAAVNRSLCVSSYKKQGFLDVDDAGTLGIALADAPDKAVRIERVMSGSSAEKAGVLPQGKLLRVGQRTPQNAREAWGMLFGETGSVAELAIRYGERTRHFSVAREPFGPLATVLRPQKTASRELPRVDAL